MYRSRFHSSTHPVNYVWSAEKNNGENKADTNKISLTVIKFRSELETRCDGLAKKEFLWLRKENQLSHQTDYETNFWT